MNAVITHKCCNFFRSLACLMYWASVTIMQQGRNSAATFGHLLEDIKLFCSEFDLVIFYMFVQVLIVWLIV